MTRPLVIALLVTACIAPGAPATSDARPCPINAGCLPCPAPCGDRHVDLHGTYEGIEVCLWLAPSDVGGETVIDTLTCER